MRQKKRRAIKAKRTLIAGVKARSASFTIPNGAYTTCTKVLRVPDHSDGNATFVGCVVVF